jgi:hypothetical protein
MSGKTDQKERYEDFLNEVIDCTKLSPMNNVSAYVEKYGVAATLIPFLRQKGVLVPLSKSYRYPLWTTNRTEHYTSKEVEMLIAEYRAWQKNGKAEASATSHINLPPSNGLSKYTTKQLTDELKHRGYSGRMFIKKELTF